MQPKSLKLKAFQPQHTQRKAVLVETFRGGRTTYRKLTTGLWKRERRGRTEGHGENRKRDEQQKENVMAETVGGMRLS